MDGLTVVCEQGKRLCEAHEQAVAKVESVSIAFVRVGGCILRVEPLRGEPFADTGDLALQYRFGG